ncbi:ubiquitin-conjugating enzyme E2 Z [Rhipicephalus microplus]|nr:ubiquitin-conjugating enzyme E2 Z-like [Rhipicephalus microplus]
MKLPPEPLDVPNADSLNDEAEYSLAAEFESDTTWGSSSIDEASTDTASELSDDDPGASLFLDTSYDSDEMDCENSVSSVESLDGAVEDPLVPECPLPSGAPSCSGENVDNRFVLPPEEWNPFNFEHEVTSHQCLVRCRHDVMNLITDPPPGVYIAPQENDITRIHALVMGPMNTPYEGGFFHFFIQCPPDFPIKPPRVRLLNTDGGRLNFHPNLYESGQVCLNILGTSDWSGVPVEWCPAMTLASVLVSIQSLMSEKPSWSVEEDDSERSCLLVQHETIRVAVCDAIEACINGTSFLPSCLREIALLIFLDNIDKYLAVMGSNLSLTGRAMWYPSGYPARTRALYQYGALVTRLWRLETEVQDLLKARDTVQQ